MFATLAGVSLFAQTVVPFGALAATYSQELQDAYDWAYGKGVTTMSPIDNANMYGAITRAEMAKMLSVYAKEVLGNTPDTSKACTFSDIDSVKWDLHEFIIESCQLGIMGQGITAFRPYDTISRAEFGTALSRVLWGDQYEGGTPYYAKHLDALKSAGIMNQIANAETTKEVRGYVMLMLQRSEANGAGIDCEDTDVVLACLEDLDNCPAACKAEYEDGGDDNTVVKSGDLAVTAKAGDNRKVVIPGTSDLDTLTFKTSEEVEITKVVLERYGYSDADDIDAVRLEDEDGTVIADEKGLTKDKATLSIKKDYRSVDGTLKATVVVRTAGTKASGSIGFKVVDVTSTAKNVDLGNYEPNLYDIITYSGANVDVTLKGSNKTYNYEEGESYEVARLQVKSNGAAIAVKGFTLKNKGTLDVEDFLDEVTVKADGKEVDGLKWKTDKDGKLTVSFNESEIDMNKRATYVVSASFKELDEYNKTIQYYLDSTTDFNALEKKTSARVTVTGSALTPSVTYTIKGGKIKLSNTKLSKVEASQSAEDVVVAEGNITVSEPISRITFTVNANSTWLEALRMVVNGDEFEWKRSNATTGYNFTFDKVEIDESGKIQFLADIADDDNLAGTIKITPNFGKTAFSGARYDVAREDVLSGDVAGTISFVDVTITAAKATLKNNLSKDVEVLNDATTTRVVLDGTYTAKKALVNLSKFYMSGTNNLTGVTVTWHLFVNGEEVAETDLFGSGNEESFSDVELKAGETASIKVEAEVEAYGSTGDIKDIKVYLGGTDEFGKDIQWANAKVMNIKVKESGSAVISAGTSANTVLRKSSNAKLAEFYIKPSNGEDDLTLDDLALSISGATISKIEVLFDGSEEDAATSATTTATYKPVIDLPADGIKVEINLTEELTGEIELTITKVNGKTQSRTFNKRYEEALVFIASQEQMWDETKFILGVDADSDVTVSNVVIYADSLSWSLMREVSEGDDIRMAGDSTAHYVNRIEYDYDVDGVTGHVNILKSAYNDYFKVGNDYAKVGKARD